LIYPVQNKSVVDELAKKQATVFAMGKSLSRFLLEFGIFCLDCIPRISRAQVCVFKSYLII
jgi:hypothetical protein